MNKRLFLPMSALLLSLLIGCASQSVNLPSTVTTTAANTSEQSSLPAQSDGSSATVVTTEATPTTTDAPKPPEPVIDTDTLVRELTASLQGADSSVPITEAFLKWIGDRYGADMLLSLQSEVQDSYSDTLWYELTGNSLFVLSDLYSGAAESADNIHLLSIGSPNAENATTTMTFGGDICFADNYVVMQYLKTTENGITDCIDPKLIAEMKAADIAFMNNEFTISDRGAPLANKYYTFRAAPEHTELYHTLGIDIVSLANNHAFDFGADAFSDTLATLKQYEIAAIGGGENLEEARKPVYYLVNGKKIAFVAATRAEKYRLTPEATENSGGVLRCYDPTLFLETIKEAKQNSDFVIACIHWGTEQSHEIEPVMQETAYQYIDAGADLIIGAHAHRLQGIEYYKDKAIFYNLGNFWFDNYDIETGLVKFELSPDGSTAFTFIPARQKDCVTAWELGSEKGNLILEHLEDYSFNVSIDENGVIRPKEE